MIDLDGFKAINDRHGHPVGDAALVHFAATLRRQLRPADTIARLGGDEFSLILMNCSGDDAYLLLERLQQVLAGSPLSVPGGAVRLRFSAGVAELHAAESLGQVLERADAALLDAKRQGKGMVALSIQPTQSAPAATADACN
jgi:diguanylate cyclase (GGDEF)-like protein